MECEIIAGRARRSIRDLDGKHRGYADAYLVLLEGATMETPWAESDMRKKWQRSDWRALKMIWQPDRTPRQLPRPTAWKEFK